MSCGRVLHAGPRPHPDVPPPCVHVGVYTGERLRGGVHQKSRGHSAPRHSHGPRSVTRTKAWQVPSCSLFSPKRFSTLQHQAQRSPRLPGAGSAKMHLSSQVPVRLPPPPPRPGRATLKPHISAEHPRFPDRGLCDLCAHLLAAGLGMVTLPGGGYEHRRTPGQAALTCTKPVQTCVLGAGVEAKFTPRPFIPSGF